MASWVIFIALSFLVRGFVFASANFVNLVFYSNGNRVPFFPLFLVLSHMCM